jgi:hypothetical protein
MVHKCAQKRMKEPLGRKAGKGRQEGGVASAGEGVGLPVNAEGGGVREGGVCWLGFGGEEEEGG